MSFESGPENDDDDAKWGGAFNNAFNARRSFSVAQQRLFRFGELERRRRRRRRRVELHDAPIFCRGEILGKLGAERR